MPPGPGRAVVCASTGNTSASASAYAVKAGLLPIVLLPAGRIQGQAGPGDRARAKVVQVESNFDECLELARKLAHDYPVTLVNSVNPVRLEGRRPLRSRWSTTSAMRPTCTSAGRQRREYLGLLAWLSSVCAGRASRTPRMWGFQAAGAAPLVLGHPVLDPDTVATAIRVGNPASATLALAARDDSGGLIEAVTDPEILAAQTFLATREGIFVEPASAAGVAGLIAQADRARWRPGSRSWSP